MNILHFITFIFDRIRMGIGMLVPIFADAADFRNWNPWVRRGLHLLMLCLVLWGLYELQKWWTGLDKLLIARAPGDFRPYYLCLIFLVLYAAIWVGYGLYRLLVQDEAQSEFPDLDRDWRIAVAGLAKVGIRLNHPESAPPLFLVLGKPAGGMDSVFRAAGWKFQYRFPDEQGSRLVVYACHDPYSVFVTVPDATSWSYICATLNGETRYAPAVGSDEAADANKTLSFDSGAGLQQMGLSASEAHELKTLLRLQSRQDLSEAQQDRLHVLAAKGDRRVENAGSTPQAIRTEMLRTGERELRFLSSLLRRERWPLCPVNGVLVLVPWAAGENENIAQAAARELSNSLSVVREVFQLHYPTIAAICDIEEARGFGQFRAAFKPDQLRQRVGQRIPLVPVRTEAAPHTVTLIRQGIQWIAHAVMPVWILNASQLSPEEREAEGQDSNRELYLLLREVYRRVPGFAAILSRVPVSEDADSGDELDALPLFGGCYVTGTGNRPIRQAFVTGVFQRLIDDQAAVAWTRRAYGDDKKYRRMTQMGYSAIVLVVIGLIAAATRY